jgi:single-stranded DNA-binding protein
VVVHGSIYQDSWEDKQTGQKRTKMKVRASNVGVDLKRAPAIVQRDHRNSTPQQVERDFGNEWKSPLNPDKDFPF